MRISTISILLVFLSLEVNAVGSVVIEFPKDNAISLPGGCALASEGAYSCNTDSYSGKVYLEKFSKVRDSHNNIPAQTEVHDGFLVPMHTVHREIFGKEHFASTLLATGDNFTTYIYSICYKANCLQAVSNRKDFIQKVMYQVSSQLVQSYQYE